MSTEIPVLEPAADDRDGPMPLADPGVDGVAATIVLATRPAPVLSHVEQRLLARFVEAVDRQLLRRASGATRDGVMDRLCRLVPVAVDLPVGSGIALIATATDSVLLHLRAPVRDRAVVRGVPTDVDLGLREWPGDPVAIVTVGETRTRLLTLRHGTLREAADGPFPVRRDPSLFLSDYLARIDDHLAEVVDPDLPIMLAGDERLTGALRDRSKLEDRIVGVLPGNQVHASPPTLLTLAQHLPARLTAVQRRALADVAVARLHDRVIAGVEAVREALPQAASPHLVIEAALLDADVIRGAGTRAETLLLESMHRDGDVTIVPTGRLHAYGGVALITTEGVQ